MKVYFSVLIIQTVQLVRLRLVSEKYVFDNFIIVSKVNSKGKTFQKQKGLGFLSQTSDFFVVTLEFKKWPVSQSSLLIIALGASFLPHFFVQPPVYSVIILVYVSLFLKQKNSCFCFLNHVISKGNF